LNLEYVRFERQAQELRDKAQIRKEEAEREWARYREEQGDRDQRDADYASEYEKLRERLKVPSFLDCFILL